MTMTQQQQLAAVAYRNQIDDITALIESGADISVSDIVEFLNAENK